MCCFEWSAAEWSALGSLLSGGGTIIGAFAVMVAAWLASSSFDSWRLQKLAERRIDQAERILTAAYNARRALARVRAYLLQPHELAAAEEHLSKQDGWVVTFGERAERMKRSQAYFIRMQAVLGEFREVEECLAMSRALWGEEVEQALESLLEQFQKVRIAAEAICWEVDDNAMLKMIQEDLTSYKGNRMDELIAAKIKVIEDACLPTLRHEK